jgi:hypothetical protein
MEIINISHFFQQNVLDVCRKLTSQLMLFKCGPKIQMLTIHVIHIILGAVQWTKLNRLNSNIFGVGIEDTIPRQQEYFSTNILSVSLHSI